MRLYSFALALVCSCFLLSYIQDSHRRVTPAHVFILLLFILCLYTLELTLAYVDETGWSFSVQFLSPCLELYMYICLMVKSCCLTSLRHWSSSPVRSIQTQPTANMSSHHVFSLPPTTSEYQCQGKKHFTNILIMNPIISSAKTPQSQKVNSSSSHISTDNLSWTISSIQTIGNPAIPTTATSTRWNF